MAAAVSSTLFGLSMKSVFDSWTALQLAVSHGFGGAQSRDKADWLVFATETWFAENQNIESYELEEFLAQVLNDEFDLLIDDASLPEVASKICLYYRLCEEGRDSDVLQKINAQPKAAIDKSQKAQQEGDDLHSYSSLEDEPDTSVTGLPFSESQTTSAANNTSTSEDCGQMDVEEEDGWEVVRRGKNR